MSAPKAQWSWELGWRHWVELSLNDTGLTYVGHNYSCQSGGAYMAGFQSYREFEKKGPIRDMPSEVEAEVRAAIAERTRGHHVVVRISGERPDEIHLEFNGESQIKRDTDVVFDGDLAPGSYKTSGILLYPGADSQGRRRMLMFSETVEVVDGPVNIEISDLEPRFKD